MDIGKLKVLALAVKSASNLDDGAAAVFEFADAVTPAAVLELIAEVERLRADEERLDYLDKFAVIAKPGQSIRDAVDAAIEKEKA
jgi:hypothetical protein